MRNPRTLRELKADPRVSSIGDERDTDDGVWVYLAPGWWNPLDECSVVHRDNWKQAMAAMADVREGEAR